MVKKVFFVLFLAIAGIAGANAQVRISGSEAPNKSAVLDLNPDDRVSEGNAALGLALPRVNLRSSGDAFPLLSHVKGMSVYNLAAAGDVSPGVYVNNGVKWLRQADSEPDFAVLGDSIIDLVHENERDGVIGNEVAGATVNGGLVRSGAGTAVSPYTLGIADEGVTGTHLVNNAVTSAKIADGAVTNADINASAAIALNKIALPSPSENSGKVLKSNGTAWVAGEDNNTDANTTYTAGKGLVLFGTTFGIDAGSVNTTMITDGTIGAADLSSMSASTGQVLKWNGTAWSPASDAGISVESDGIIGNEITNATAGGGLTRSGAGTAASPYTLGIATAGVTTSHIADNAVTTGKIADGAIKAEDLNSMGAASGQVLTYNGSAWEPKSSSGPKFLGMLSAAVSVPAGSTEVNYMLNMNQCSAIGMTDTDSSKRYFGIVTNIGAYQAATSFNIVSGYDYFYPYVKLIWGTAVNYAFQTQVYVLVYEY
jgi:hypothetical protein